ncbi:MAG: general secretion pathway protein GspE [Helicobacteraceae bacterium]|nr:general secretion pathway protein GspE [Helicobacteraceae bacterium]
MDLLTDGLFYAGHITQEQLNEHETLEHLIDNNVITIEFVIKFVVDEIRLGKYEISFLKAYPFLSEEAILEKLAEVMKVQFMDLDSFDVDFRTAEKLPFVQLQKFRALPLFQDELSVTVVFADPLDIEATESIQRLFPRKPIQIAIATPKQINIYLQKMELKDSVKELVTNIRNELNSIGTLEEQQEASSVLKLIEVLLKSCIKSRGSDIHIEPTEKNCVVRTRIDGKLSEMFLFDKDIYPPLASRLKLLANLDIAEKRKPQDGRFSYEVAEAEFDFRISTLPILYGESIVMRVLDKERALIRLDEAGMDKVNYKKLHKSLQAPFGIILVTGPTGSGKTTTLYGALNELRNVAEKVITVEDPVEYRMNLIQQVQVNTKVGLTFAAALRSILRQDPDKIMIGEIRDKETLEIAIKSALTGHLVISTLHTNDSVSAITRMSDMGIAPYLISGAVVAIQAQRLLRKICLSCKKEAVLPQLILNDYKKYIPEGTVFYEGEGCRECNNSGFFGREMICEVLEISETISSMIARGSNKEEILTKAIEEGFIGMFSNAMDKAIAGITTLEEVISVAKES